MKAQRATDLAADRWIWTTACAIATVLHLGAAAFAISGREAVELSAEDLGGLVVVEFTPVVSLADSPEESVAPSEASANAASSPEIEQKKSASVEDDTPPAESSPHEAPPDLQLSQQKTIDKQEAVEDAQPTEANEAMQAAAPSAAAVASQSSSPPSPMEHATSEAPTEGSTNKADDAPASWKRTLVAHLGKHKRYPAQARSLRHEGEVAVRFRVNRAGRVISASVSRSSGFPDLDAAALDLFKRAQPLPPFPPSMRSVETELVAPINFRLR